MIDLKAASTAGKKATWEETALIPRKIELEVTDLKAASTAGKKDTWVETALIPRKKELVATGAVNALVSTAAMKAT